MSAYQLPPVVWPATVMAVCGLAVWRGGDEERLAAGGLLAGWSLTLVLYRFQGQSTEWGIFAVDVALLALLVWIAMKSGRYWPLFAAGFHLLAVITHVARTVDSQVSGWAYITAEIIWGYLLAGTIGFAAWRYRAPDLGAGRPEPRPR